MNGATPSGPSTSTSDEHGGEGDGLGRERPAGERGAGQRATVAAGTNWLDQHQPDDHDDHRVDRRADDVAGEDPAEHVEGVLDRVGPEEHPAEAHEVEREDPAPPHAEAAVGPVDGDGRATSSTAGPPSGRRRGGRRLGAVGHVAVRDVAALGVAALAQPALDGQAAAVEQRPRPRRSRPRRATARRGAW